MRARTSCRGRGGRPKQRSGLCHLRRVSPMLGHWIGLACLRVGASVMASASALTIHCAADRRGGGDLRSDFLRSRRRTAAWLTQALHPYHPCSVRPSPAWTAGRRHLDDRHPRFRPRPVQARRGRWAKRRRRPGALSAPTTETPGIVASATATLVWSGADQFLALTRDGTGDAPPRSFPASTARHRSRSKATAIASWRVSGPRVRDMLAKLSSLDLHPNEFPVGAAATTSIDHTSVILWREPDADGSSVFSILIFASFAVSLWETMADAAAEYGLVTGNAGF